MKLTSTGPSSENENHNACCDFNFKKHIKKSVGPISWEFKDNSLQLSGPLVRKTVGALLPHVKSWQGVCRIDLKNVTDIDSAGLALLTQAAVSVCSSQPYWLNASAKIKALSELYNLNRFINLE